MRADVIPGSVFPDYELSDHTATRRKLSVLQGQHLMVLVLSRGGFCPKDRRQAELLVQFHREMEVSYCRLVTISTDSLSDTNEYRHPGGSTLAVLIGCRAHRLEGPRYRGIHGPSPQSDDPAHNYS
jgi:peroxiredoxin